jgi:hypothetical protein
MLMMALAIILLVVGFIGLLVYIVFLLSVVSKYGIGPAMLASTRQSKEREQ